MDCDCCNKKATVFLTQIKGDKMQKVNLCEECSAKQGVTDPTGFALADLLSGIGSEKPVRRPKANDPTCPECGFTLTDFKKTGRLGCPACYDVFRSNVTALLGAMHRGARHVGKVPTHFTPSAGDDDVPADEGVDTRSDRDVRVDVDEMAGLQAELAQAVAQENYEKAARLRDRIARLKDAPRDEAASAGRSAKSEPREFRDE